MISTRGHCHQRALQKPAFRSVLVCLVQHQPQSNFNHQLHEKSSTTCYTIGNAVYTHDKVMSNFPQQPYGQPGFPNKDQTQGSWSSTTIETTQSYTYDQNGQMVVQQTPQEAPQQVQYSAPAPVPQPSIDYNALLRPPPQQPIDYNALLRPPPPNSGANSQTQQTITTEHVVNTTNTNNSSTAQTSSSSQGGTLRQQAAARGDAALRQFDRDIQARLIQASGSLCPLGLSYEIVAEGYLCHGNTHFVSHEEVDAMLQGQRPYGPSIETVNSGYGTRRIRSNRLPERADANNLNDPFTDLRMPRRPYGGGGYGYGGYGYGGYGRRI